MSRFDAGERVALRFVIEGRLASGGMAEVYVARMKLARGVERRVALKRIHPHLAEHPEFVTMFVDEARLMAELTHPGLVPVLDVVEDGTDLMLVLEYVPGWDLASLLGRAPRVPIDAAVFVARSIAATLAYVHDATDRSGHALSIVHRDVTPANVLVGADRTVRLLDFGVAKAAQRATRTATSTLKGKFAYMAPEQAAAGAVDGRTDLYALGLVLHEMITGERALGRGDEIETLKIAMKPSIERLSTKEPEVPPALDSLVVSLLAHDRAGRPAHASEVRDALDAVHRDLGETGATSLDRYVASAMGSSARALKTQRSSVDAAFAAVLGTGAHETGTDVRTKAPSVPRSLLTGAAINEERAIVAPREAEIPRAEPAPRSRRWLAFGAIAVVAVAGTGATLGFLANGSEPRDRETETRTDVAPPAAPAFVRVTSEPAGARVFLGDRALEEPTPTVAPVEAGQAQTIRIELDDYRTIERTITPAESETTTVHERLVRLPGVLSIASEPAGASVTIGGEERGTTPLELRDLPRERAEVRLALAGHVPVVREIDLTTMHTESIDVRLAREAERMGAIQVNADNQNVTLRIDGRVVARELPWTGPVPPGRHEVSVSDGERTLDRVLNVRSGETTRTGFFFRR